MGSVRTRYKAAFTAANYDRIDLTLKKGRKEELKDHAKTQGESVNAFLNRAIEETMARDKVFSQNDRKERIEALNVITPKVVQVAKETLGETLEKIILYGSYARGDFDAESDINIMIIANIPVGSHNHINHDIHEQLNYIDLEYNVVLSLNVKDSETFSKSCSASPFFLKMVDEGKVLFNK